MMIAGQLSVKLTFLLVGQSKGVHTHLRECLLENPSISLPNALSNY